MKKKIVLFLLNLLIIFLCIKYEIIYAYGKPFVYGSAFFLINNSSYIEWLVEKSNASLQADTLHHYCIFGVNRVVDVIASQEPEVKITYNDPGLSKN